MKTQRSTSDTAGIIEFLWNRFDLHSAADTDLEWIGGAIDVAETMATRLSATLESIGCLVCQDLTEDGESKSGAFRGHDLPRLLWSAADSLKTIGQIAFIGNEAEFKLRKRIEEQRDAANRECMAARLALNAVTVAKKVTSKGVSHV